MHTDTFDAPPHPEPHRQPQPHSHPPLTPPYPQSCPSPDPILRPLRRQGWSLANEMLIMGRKLSAEEALSAGLVSTLITAHSHEAFLQQVCFLLFFAFLSIAFAFQLVRGFSLGDVQDNAMPWSQVSSLLLPPRRYVSSFLSHTGFSIPAVRCQ